MNAANCDFGQVGESLRFFLKVIKQEDSNNMETGIQNQLVVASEVLSKEE